MPANPFNPLEDPVNPKRPGLLSDFGPDCADDMTDGGPNPLTDPTSAVWNALRAVLAGFGAVIEHTVITIDYPGGNPAIVNVKSANAQLVADNLSITRTGGGDTHGDLTIALLVPWIPSTAYGLYAVVRPTVPNGFMYRCTTAGTTGSSEPTWPTTLGSTVADGTAVWTCYATSSPPTQVSKFPDPIADATVAICDDVDIDRFRAKAVAGPPAGWRVRTKLGATATDVRCALRIY